MNCTTCYKDKDEEFVNKTSRKDLYLNVKGRLHIDTPYKMCNMNGNSF
jgi:hypothetical protein